MQRLKIAARQEGLMGFNGGCLCEAVRYRIDRTHLNAMHCYCGMCRKAHGSAFSTHVVVRPEQLSWTRGEQELVAYQSSADGFREFCSSCGTHVLVHGQTGDGNLALPAGTLDGDPPLRIMGHMYTEALVNWFEIKDALPQYERWPPGYGPV